MVKYLIIEDERLAYKELKRMLSLQRSDYVLAVAATASNRLNFRFLQET